MPMDTGTLKCSFSDIELVINYHCKDVVSRFAIVAQINLPIIFSCSIIIIFHV